MLYRRLALSGEPPPQTEKWLTVELPFTKEFNEHYCAPGTESVYRTEGGGAGEGGCRHPVKAPA